MSAATEGKCVNCGQTTTLSCKKCFEGVDANGKGIPVHFLCSGECTKANLDVHKKTCEHAGQLKKLYRGGSLLKKVFYTWREAMFDANIKKVEVVDDKLIFYCADIEADESGLYPFPTKLISDAKHKKALMCFEASGDGVAYLFELMKEIVADMTIASSLFN